MSIIFALIIDLGLKLGFRDIKGRVVSFEFSEIWKVTINATREEQGNVPAFHALVECNGWTVTILGPHGGGPILGVSEDELIAALKAAGAELPPEPEKEPDPQARLPGVEP